MWITYGGKVGIGTSTPGALLDVAGTARAQIVEITGADLAERFELVAPAEPGTVLAIDPAGSGRLRLRPALEP